MQGANLFPGVVVLELHRLVTTNEMPGLYVTCMRQGDTSMLHHYTTSVLNSMSWGRGCITVLASQSACVGWSRRARPVLNDRHSSCRPERRVIAIEPTISKHMLESAIVIAGSLAAGRCAASGIVSAGRRRCRRDGKRPSAKFPPETRI